jgi:enoyl-[acyl-carrier protein] reductase II
MDQFARTQEVYFGGDLEAGIALTGQVAGRITEVLPVESIIHETVRQCRERMASFDKLR